MSIFSHYDDFEEGTLGDFVYDVGVKEGTYVEGNGTDSIGFGWYDPPAGPHDNFGRLRWVNDPAVATAVDSGEVAVDFILRNGSYGTGTANGLVVRLGQMEGGGPTNFGVSFRVNDHGGVVYIVPNNSDVTSANGTLALDVWHTAKITWTGLEVQFRISAGPDLVDSYDAIMSYPPVDRITWFPIQISSAFDVDLDNVHYVSPIPSPPEPPLPGHAPGGSMSGVPFQSHHGDFVYEYVAEGSENSVLVKGPTGNQPFAARHCGAFEVPGNDQVTVQGQFASDLDLYLDVYALLYDRDNRGALIEGDTVPVREGIAIASVVTRKDTWTQVDITVAGVESSHWRPKFVFWVPDGTGGKDPLPANTSVLMDCLYVPENGLPVVAEPYLDGDQPGGTWEGTPRISTSIWGTAFVDPDAPVDLTAVVSPETLAH